MAEIDQGQLKGAFDSLLSYIDKPWKVIAIAFLGVLAFGGYFVYSNQAFLLAAYEKKKTLPRIDESKIDNAASFLIKQTGADMVAIFEVDVILNTRHLLRAYSKEGRYKQHDGEDVGMLSQNQDNNNDLMSLYAGNIPCGAYNRAQSIVGLWYLQQGVTFTCRISVPETPGIFSGQITIGFKNVPADIGKVQDMLILASNGLIKK
jgi:hypothetical protein